MWNSVCPAQCVTIAGDQPDVSHRPVLERDGKKMQPVSILDTVDGADVDFFICRDRGAMYAEEQDKEPDAATDQP